MDRNARWANRPRLRAQDRTFRGNRERFPGCYATHRRNRCTQLRAFPGLAHGAHRHFHGHVRRQRGLAYWCKEKRSLCEACRAWRLCKWDSAEQELSRHSPNLGHEERHIMASNTDGVVYSCSFGKRSASCYSIAPLPSSFLCCDYTCLACNCRVSLCFGIQDKDLDCPYLPAP